MKYTFQDSTELPYQRDVIEDLQEFIKVSKMVLPIENSSIEMNDEWDKQCSSLEMGLKKLESMQKEIISFVDDITKEEELKEILDCRNKIVDTCNSSCSGSIEGIRSQIDSIRSRAEAEMDKVELQILSSLSSFFKGGVYGTEKKYSVLVKKSILMGIMTSSVSGLEYESEITFSNSSLNVKDFQNSLFLPTWTKSGLIYKEDKVKMEDVSEFYLKSLDYDGSVNFSASFENRKATRDFQIQLSEDVYRIFYDSDEITSDPTLAKYVNMEDISGFVGALCSYVENNIKHRKLVKICLDGENAISSSQIFDCLKLIAEQYADIIRECVERGYVDNEITIKLEEQDGARTEKYVTKEEIFDDLSEIGSEGLELASILGVEDT